MKGEFCCLRCSKIRRGCRIVEHWGRCEDSPKKILLGRPGIETLRWVAGAGRARWGRQHRRSVGQAGLSRLKQLQKQWRAFACTVSSIWPCDFPSHLCIGPFVLCILVLDTKDRANVAPDLWRAVGLARASFPGRGKGRPSNPRAQRRQKKQKFWGIARF